MWKGTWVPFPRSKERKERHSMTHSITTFFVALAAFVFHEYIDPWSVGDPEDIWAMYTADLAFDAWERSVGGVHPQACVCLFCRNRPPLAEATADAEARGWEPPEEEEGDLSFLDATDVQAF